VPPDETGKLMVRTGVVVPENDAVPVEPEFVTEVLSD
jgi:hypothetical protein